METKYYTVSIQQGNKSSRNRKRRRILRRGIRCACGIIGTLSVLCLIGIAGGSDANLITIKQCILRSIVALLALWVSVAISKMVGDEYNG